MMTEGLADDLQQRMDELQELSRKAISRSAPALRLVGTKAQALSRAAASASADAAAEAGDALPATGEELLGMV